MDVEAESPVAAETSVTSVTESEASEAHVLFDESHLMASDAEAEALETSALSVPDVEVQTLNVADVEAHTLDASLEESSQIDTIDTRSTSDGFPSPSPLVEKKLVRGGQETLNGQTRSQRPPAFQSVD